MRMQLASPNRHHSSAIALVRVALAGAMLAATAAGCGGVQFDRTDGAFKYRALPVGSAVVVVANTGGLQQPVVDIGVLRVVEDSSVATPDLDKATANLKRHAPRYGCDAVVNVQVTSQEKKSTRKTKRLGADGKPVFDETEVSTYAHSFSARCVRSAAAPGGLNDAEVAAPTTTAPVKLAPEATPPKAPAANVDATPGGGESDADVVELWAALRRYDKTFLSHWSDRLRAAPASADEALDAMNELMAQVTGPAGLWRKMAPQQWFGCPATPASPECVKLAAASSEFEPWDRFAEKLARKRGAEAKPWLKRNKARMLGYIDRYVPSVVSLSGLQGTRLYAEKVR